MQRRTFLAASGGSAAVLGLSACGGGGDSGGDGGSSTTLTLATIAAPQPWDLKDAGFGNNTIYYQPVYDSLLLASAEAELEPNLATEWSWDASQTVLTLKLRTDVKFTDGTAFDASAVKANLENTKTGSNEAATHLAGLKSVDVVDPSTVTVTITAPDPSLLANLANVSGMMASPKAIGTPGLQTQPVGSGPYVLSGSGTTAGSQYTFTRNADYWNKAAFPFDTIVFKYLSDATALVNALRSGQIDAGQITDYKQAEPLESAGLNVVKYSPGDITGLYIWDRGGKILPALKDVRVRQALNHAMDREAIVKANGGLGKPTAQVFNPDTGAYDETLNDLYPYDVAKAKSLLAEAGYPNGFEVAMPDFSAVFPSAQASITEALQAIGVTPKYETVPSDQLITQLLSGKWAMCWFILASFRAWDTVSIEIAPDSLWNLTKYTDPQAQALIDQAQRATDDTTRDGILRQLNEYTVQQAWNAPWSTSEAYHASSKKVTVVQRKFATAPWIYDYKPAN